MNNRIKLITNINHSFSLNNAANATDSNACDTNQTFYIICIYTTRTNTIATIRKFHSTICQFVSSLLCLPSDRKGVRH